MVDMKWITDNAVAKYDIVITNQYGPHECLKEAKDYLFRTHPDLVAYHLYKSAQEYGDSQKEQKHNLRYGVLESRESLIIYIHNVESKETKYIPYHILKG